jgi:Tfp pilus assembly protein PilO
MASEEQQYTSAFKKEVAQKALNQSKQNLDQLSEDYEVPVSKILVWATELENAIDSLDVAFSSSSEVQEKSESSQVDVEISDSSVADAVEHGVMLDQLNYKRLVFWSVFGTVLVVVFVVALFEMFQYNERLTQENVSANSEYYQVNQLKKEAQTKLDSFGVVDLENGIYRIPIDSAISEIAADE